VDSISENERPLPPLPKSFSEPLILLNKPLPLLCPRRSRSESGLADAFRRSTGERYQATESYHSAAQTLNSPTSTSSTSTITPIPRLHIRGPTSEGILEAVPVEEATELRQKSSDDSALHLHKMGISQQLRCMSQLSDVAEDDITTASPHPWTFHHRERSDLGLHNGPGRRPRHVSSSGVNSATMPSSWGRVRSPGLSTASSVYSRPTSAGASTDNYPSETPDIEPVPQVDLNALFADWPLAPSTSAPAREKSATGSQRSLLSGRRNKPLPPTPNRKDSGTASFVTAGSVKWSSPPQRARSPNESVLTTASKSSKFLERFSPPKRTVKKRRSIFKFLRPGSRKQQARSISTPVLYKTVGTYDGQSEDPALLTVQYELDEHPSHSNRSVSMIDFAVAAGGDTLSQLPGPGSLQRRPTLADYERNLTVLGDDRRRPSAIDVNSAKEVQEDDHRNSVGLRRRISRARPLKDDASPLMAQALEKHQQEKALFRSASKQRESSNSFRNAPIFKSLSPFSSGVPTPDNRSELLGPRGKARVSTSPGRSLSSTDLAVPGASASVSSKKGNKARVQSTHVQDSLPLAKKRIGTALESWSRYPSHSRADRCASAGQQDNVITRDFAVDIDHAAIQETDETEADKGASPKNRWSGKKGNHKAPLSKSRSMTFSSIMRYYSNMFSSTSVGHNRRTSVSTGGRLEYPELELLPPQLAAEPIIHAHHKHSGALTRLKEHAKEDAGKIREFVQEEEDKVEDFVREEEDRFETFVRREEDLVEGFVKKEEGKLKDYVRAEEDKFKHHHWRHHSSDRGSSGRESPFREISLFEVPRDRSQDSATRRNTIAIGPNDDEVDDGPTSGGSVTTDAGLKFDGAASVGIEIETKHSSVSKADMWSDVYRQCLIRPPSSARDEQNRSSNSATNPIRPCSMPPPILKLTKARSPEQPRLIDPKATIRRFPSVTVVDDRKGHFRSISLISVKTSRSTGFERSSTHDLLELVQSREREEREKLLKPVQSIEEVKEVAAY